MAWTSSNHLLTRNGSTLLEYSPTQNTTYNSTSLHGVIASHPITGLDPGGHGIFDFVHRDPKTMVPYLSTTKTEAGTRSIRIGRWQLPLAAVRCLGGSGLLDSGHS